MTKTTPRCKKCQGAALTLTNGKLRCPVCLTEFMINFQGKPIVINKPVQETGQNELCGSNKSTTP